MKEGQGLVGSEDRVSAVLLTECDSWVCYFLPGYSVPQFHHFKIEVSPVSVSQHR